MLSSVLRGRKRQAKGSDRCVDFMRCLRPVEAIVVQVDAQAVLKAANAGKRKSADKVPDAKHYSWPPRSAASLARATTFFSRT